MRPQSSGRSPAARSGASGGYAGRGLHGEVVESLGSRIVSGALAEGETLDVVRLEHELDVSRTVVREALRALKAKGLIDARQKRGTFVRSRGSWNLLDADIMRWQFQADNDSRLLVDLSEVRAIIEPASARMAAERRDDADLDAMSAALEVMSRSVDGPEELVEADLAFHRALLCATHNELLVRMEVILEAGLAARDLLVHGAVGDDDPTPAHRAVYEAIAAGDPDSAERAVRALLEKSTTDLESVRRAAERTDS